MSEVKSISDQFISKLHESEKKTVEFENKARNTLTEERKRQREK